MYDTINALLYNDNDQSTQLQLATSIPATVGSNSPLIIHDYEDNDMEFGSYDDHTSSSSIDLDFAPLIVNFDDDLPIEI